VSYSVTGKSYDNPFSSAYTFAEVSMDCVYLSRFHCGRLIQTTGCATHCCCRYSQRTQENWASPM